MIDIRKLKELVRLMVENELTELDLRDSEEQVTMRRPTAGAMVSPMGAPTLVNAPPHLMHAMPAVGAGGSPVASSAAGNGAVAGETSGRDSAAAVEDSSLITIQSPMVGTFYATPNPDSPAFVNVGTAVSPEKVVCIIEAMKIFNEIKAECTGVIRKVLVKSGQPVEFGQPMFLVKPG